MAQPVPLWSFGSWWKCACNLCSDARLRMMLRTWRRGGLNFRCRRRISACSYRDTVRRKNVDTPSGAKSSIRCSPIPSCVGLSLDRLLCHGDGSRHGQEAPLSQHYLDQVIGFAKDILEKVPYPWVEARPSARRLNRIYGMVPAASRAPGPRLLQHYFLVLSLTSSLGN